MKKARWIALAVLATLAVAVPTAQAHGTYYYKKPGRMCTPCMAIGQLHANVANWAHITDCGGWNNNNCYHQVLEQDRDGDVHWERDLGGRGWVGLDHAARGGLPVTISHTDFTFELAYVSAYQTW